MGEDHFVWLGIPWKLLCKADTFLFSGWNTEQFCLIVAWTHLVQFDYVNCGSLINLNFARPTTSIGKDALSKFWSDMYFQHMAESEQGPKTDLYGEWYICGSEVFKAIFY